MGHASRFVVLMPTPVPRLVPSPPIHQSISPTMATKMPRYSIFLHKTHQFFWIFGGLYVLLLVLGGTPFMQKQ